MYLYPVCQINALTLVFYPNNFLIYSLCEFLIEVNLIYIDKTFHVIQYFENIYLPLRLYLSRKEGGEGLVNILNMCRTQEENMRNTFLTSEDLFIKTVAQIDEGYTPLSLKCEILNILKKDPMVWNDTFSMRSSLTFSVMTLLKKIININDWWISLFRNWWIYYTL